MGLANSLYTSASYSEYNYLTLSQDINVAANRKFSLNGMPAIDCRSMLRRSCCDVVVQVLVLLDPNPLAIRNTFQHID